MAPSPSPTQAPPGGGIGFSFFMTDVPSTLDLVERAERAGVEMAWIVMQAERYDTPTVAAAALSRTDRISVGTSIVPAFTRHPLALATQAVALEGVAPGRFRLGVGTGNLDTMAEKFGTPIDEPLRRLHEYVTVLRAALAEGASRFRGSYYDTDTELAMAAPTPVIVAALGPKAFAVAGSAADAAMAWMCPVDYLDAVARPAVEKGAGDVGRPAPPIITHVTAVVNSDPVAARTIARPMVQSFGTNRQFSAMFAKSGMPIGADGSPSDELVDAVIVSGNESTLADRLGELAEREDELLVTVHTSGDERGEQDAVLRAIGNATRVLTG